MKNEQLATGVLRSGIISLLSEEEIARVSAAETWNCLAVGEEYIDLEQLDHGVCLAMGVPPHMGRILPRRAVHRDTWSKILTQLTGMDMATTSDETHLATPHNT
jgi:hypothetical protein